MAPDFVSGLPSRTSLSLHPDRSVFCALNSPHKVQYRWVPITKLKSYSRTACLKLHPGDLDCSLLCSQTLQTLIYSQSAGSLPRTVNLTSPLPTGRELLTVVPTALLSFWKRIKTYQYLSGMFNPSLASLRFSPLNLSLSAPNAHLLQ